MAEARGVPRGNYDGPVHDVISMAKSVPPTPTSRGPPCPKTQTGTRNLHQSGFTLAGSIDPSRHVSAFYWIYMVDQAFILLQEHRLTTTFLVALLRGLWHLLVVAPTSHLYLKKTRCWIQSTEVLLLQDIAEP